MHLALTSTSPRSSRSRERRHPRLEVDSESRVLEFALAHVIGRHRSSPRSFDVCEPWSGLHPSRTGASVDSRRRCAGNRIAFPRVVEANTVTTDSRHVALAGSCFGLWTLRFPGHPRRRGGISSSARVPSEVLTAGDRHGISSPGMLCLRRETSALTKR